MKRRRLLWLLITPLLLTAKQTPDTVPTKPPKPQFFAGVVIEVDGEHVKVSRSQVGRTAETHVFAIDKKTKAPKGGVKLRSLVTVRYQHLPEHDVALEIQVRPSSHPQKAS